MSNNKPWEKYGYSEAEWRAMEQIIAHCSARYREDLAKGNDFFNPRPATHEGFWTRMKHLFSRKWLAA